jgi:surface antigen
MRTSVLILSGIFLTAALGRPAPAYAGDDALLGTGIGAAIGGLFGSQIGHGPGQFAATTTGVVVGGLVGNSVGHQMDEDSSRYPSGGSAVVIEPAPPIAYNGYTPNYVAPPAPPPTYVDPNAGTYCREYSQEIRIDGELKESYGTACLQPDGSWRIVQ